MARQFFKAGDCILDENKEKIFRLVKPVTFNSKFYIAHVEDLKNKRECLLKYVDCNDANYELNNLYREGNFQFYFPYIERVYGNFHGFDPDGLEIYGVSVEFIYGQNLFDYRTQLEQKLQMGLIDEDYIERIVFRQMLQFLYGIQYYSGFAQKQYLHRDLKPQNIMITPEGNVKIVDFDYAHISGSKKTQNSVGWSIPFSAGYSSPEIYSFKRMNIMPNIETEIYSAGRIFFFWLNGLEYYTEDQIEVKRNAKNDGGIPSSALYCMNEELSYGIESNRDRIKAKFLNKKYEKILSIMDRMCSAPNTKNRYENIDDVLEDMYNFLFDFYGGTSQYVLNLLDISNAPLLSARWETPNKKFVMVSYKMEDGEKKGAPLYENGMRDIWIDNKILLTVYNIGQKIYYYTFDTSIKLETEQYREEEEYRVYDKDFFRWKGRKVIFSIREP